MFSHRSYVKCLAGRLTETCRDLLMEVAEPGPGDAEMRQSLRRMVERRSRHSVKPPLPTRMEPAAQAQQL